MSDIVTSVAPIAPVAAAGRIGAFVQPGSGDTGEQSSSQNQGVNKPLTSVPSSADVVSLQSLQAQDPTQADPGNTTVQSVTQVQAQAALYAAKAVAQAQQAETQNKNQGKQQGSVQQAASALSGYFADIHPDVNFRVEQQSGGEVVVMVNAMTGKVLQTISGDEARVLAISLLGKSAPAEQIA